MLFQTVVELPTPPWKIEPYHTVAFIGSCFAQNIGKRFSADHFHTIINPYGVMYNPISVLHTLFGEPYPAPSSQAYHPITCDVAIISLGTNHVYREISSGKIVDNCQKRPQKEFAEEKLSVEQCQAVLANGVAALRKQNPHTKVIFTVSPIRYKKYGFHESNLSKSTLLLAIDQLIAAQQDESLLYFPSYEIVQDELRDYRFYQPDMLHPTEQAADYIYEKFRQCCFSAQAQAMVAAWQPLKKALQHRPLHPEEAAYKAFMQETQRKIIEFENKYFNEE